MTESPQPRVRIPPGAFLPTRERADLAGLLDDPDEQGSDAVATGAEVADAAGEPSAAEPEPLPEPLPEPVPPPAPAGEPEVEAAAPLGPDRPAVASGTADRRNIMVSPPLIAALVEARRQLDLTNTEIWALAYVEISSDFDKLFVAQDWEGSPFARRRRKRVGVGAQSQLRLSLDAAQRELLAAEAGRVKAESVSAFVEIVLWEFLRRRNITEPGPKKRAARASD